MHPIKLLFLLISFNPILSLGRRWEKGDECPESITTLIPGYKSLGREGTSFDTMASVHSALLSCPNITSLDLRVTLLGCSEFPDRWNFPFKLEGGDKYPPLKSLRLEGYRFLGQEWEESKISEIGYPGQWRIEKFFDWWRSGNLEKYMKFRKIESAQRSKTNLDLWLDAMDWEQLESLALIDNHGQDVFLEKAAPRLKSLQNLEIEGKEGNTTLRFIGGLRENSLRNLTLTAGWSTDVLLPILTRHGNSICYLDIHARENLYETSKAFSISQLSLLSSMAPNLAHLSTNIHRNGMWPLEIFDAISSIKSLQTAELWLDITSECQRQKPDPYTRQLSEWERIHPGECVGEDRYQAPFVSDKSALDVFKVLRGKKVGMELKGVTFWVGDWMRAWDGPLYFPDWLEGKRAKVVCSVEGKSEGEAWCVVEVGDKYWERGGYQYYDDY
ncbi:hypothetical protein CC78DRAFT_205284 [Lojkania enalia]|uniref:Uncharacterized protein n=1 Tax=Lojkania enalia TaxID=147567 RepID=A0A9P4MXM8_9PLEO|nr:hypothetical protein CC78DRAFT_205284 [Didymosphaeria enalia]